MVAQATTILLTTKEDSNKKRIAKYNNSEKGRLRSLRYDSTPNGKYLKWKRNLRARILQKKKRISELERILREQEITY